MFIPNEDAARWIRERLTKAKKATFAVAFWGEGAIDSLGIDRAKSARIICNLSMGGSNPSEIRKLMGLPNIVVQQCDQLHAKIYLFETEALVGSSNASTNGLSLPGEEAGGWLEANIAVKDRAVLDQISAWVKSIQTGDISEGDLRKAEAAWKRRRRLTWHPKSPKPRDENSSPSLLAAVANDPDRFRGFGFVFTQGIATKRARDRGAKAAAQQDASLDLAELKRWPRGNVFSDWSRDEVSAWPFQFLCIHRARTGRIGYFFYERTHPAVDEGVVLASRKMAIRTERGLKRSEKAMSDADAVVLKILFQQVDNGGRRICINGEELAQMLSDADVRL
jgi:hypothetical protein